MDIETRLTNLENLVDSLVTIINNQKFYTDADIAGARQNINEITPWTATKTAYIDDTECIFEGVPQGNVTVYCSVPHTVEKQDGRVVVKFEALTEVIDITISIL